MNSPDATARTNKALVGRYDRLVAQARRRIELADSTDERQALLARAERVNARGLRELRRRHEESEEKLWSASLFRPLQP